ncbi:MAG: 5-oxoprolinase subunit PxpB [Bacteroidota bacterium]
MSVPSLIKYGEQGYLIQFEEKISLDISQKVHQLASSLESHSIAGIRGMIPAYNSLTLYTDPNTFQLTQLESFLKTWQVSDTQVQTKGRILRIPVCYGGEYGPDLESLAEYHQLSVEEMITLHCYNLYHIYNFGFLPGFAYLGNVPTEKASPRLGTPRTRVAAGSVAITGKQTAIYPTETAAGWQIIGRTPISVLNHSLEIPFLFRAGDQISFYSIAEGTFLEMRENPLDWQKVYG